MVGALHNLLLDHDTFLGLELVDKRGDILVRHHGILVAMEFAVEAQKLISISLEGSVG